MDLVTSIKESVSDVAVKNLAAYLGEDINGTKLGLDLGISTFLAGVIKFAATDKTGRNLMAILNDGGHTGDILNNFETFSGNSEKSRLLETIGGNIVNHFLKDKSSGIAEKIAGHAGIQKKSADTLLHLSAPLVLGFVGKKAREENMSAGALKACLYEATDDVSGALPSTILHALNLPRFNRGKSSPLSHYNAVKELNKDRKGENWSMILPWVLLLFVGGLIYYFSRTKAIREPQVVEKKADVQPSEIFLPADTTAETTGPQTATPAPAATDTVKVISVPKEVKEPVNHNEPVVRKEEVPKKEAPKNVPEEETSEDTTPAGLTGVPAAVFARNSAEVVGGSAIQSLITPLKEGRKKLVLTPLRGSGRVAVDRAYAIRDYLLENGVQLSQVEIASPGKGKNPSGVAYRINN